MGHKQHNPDAKSLLLVSTAEKSKKWPASRTEMRDIGALRAYERNARTHSDAQIDQIARSIREWGWTNPVLCTEDGMIIAGHGRILAAERLGYDQVPVMIAVGWTPAQVKAYVIADNKLALNAGWDEEILAAELADLEEMGFAVDLIGFSADEMADLRPASDRYNTDPDDCPDAGPSPVSRAGDVWQLGPHRVVCGDSTSTDDVAKVMGSAFADACWTDPPYNVNYEAAAGSIENDNLPDETFAAFLLDAFVAAFSFLKPGSAIYIAHADTEGLNFRAAFKSAGFKLSGCLIWAKGSLVLGRSDYQWQHEPILYGWKPGAAHRWYGGRKQTTVTELEGSVFTFQADGTLVVRVGSESIIVRGKDLKAEAVEPTVLRCEKPRKSSDHPTMKPVELIQRMLKNSTREGDVVLDLFGGSGSTLIACEMMGRQARLVELDARFVDVIVKRWQEFTGKSATLEVDGRTFEAVSAQHFNGGGRDG